ncbi:MAG: zinc ribbon domain-containing protein [Firmicutes bacterium]|nr:zinc ribbon domain-containing protein [Bacillota bacterium]
MPTYEFICKKCHEKFTVFTSISQKDRIKCPHCSSSDLKQLFGSPFFFSGRKGGCQAPPRSGLG